LASVQGNFVAMMAHGTGVVSWPIRSSLLIFAAFAALPSQLGSGTPAMAATAFAVTAPASAGSYFSSLILILVPGIAVAGGASALYSRRGSSAKIVWVLATALLVLFTLALPLAAPNPYAAPSAGQEKAAPQQLAPRSGEERLLPDGTFMRVADPRPGNGPIEEGWQQALWTEMAEAIQKGEEQVVMVFSRENCPWCDRLHPVLQNAMKRRAAAIAEGSQPEGVALLNAPLRIFVYDAMEFGPIMQRFRITGFPTIMAFGPPGSRPAMVPGYLGDDDFDRLLAEIAVAEPATEEKTTNKKRRGVFR